MGVNIYIAMQNYTYIEWDGGGEEEKMSKKILARIAVTVRPARVLKETEKGKNKEPPLIVSIPRIIANAVGVQQRDQMMMYTDGKRIYLDKIEEPEL